MTGSVDRPVAEPTEEEIRAFHKTLSNWGRWGEDDCRGTLNFLSESATRQAADLVVEGRVVSLARQITMKRSVENPEPPVHFMIASGDAAPASGRAVAADWYGMTFHGNAVTHLDSLAHMFWDGQMYNGRPASMVNQLFGARWGSVEEAGDGVVTRGVLLDFPKYFGVDFLPEGYRLHPEDLEGAARDAGVEVGQGDALLVRTGRDVKRDERPPYLPESTGSAGLSAACLPWIREREVALVGADAGNDAFPPIYPNSHSPLHDVGIVAMGLWILDNMLLEPLVDVANSLSRATFQFVGAPLKLQRGTGSPINPLAVF